MLKITQLLPAERMISKGKGVSLAGDKQENVLKSMYVMAAQLSEHMKNQGTVHFKWVNGVVCE